MGTKRAVCERILLALSRSPEAGDYKTPHEQRGLDNALSLLSEAFPGFVDKVKGKEVLDFGCGTGLQAIAMAQAGARYVFGLDTNERYLARARELADNVGLQSRVQFGVKLVDSERGRFDLVVCQNSMEHFPDPQQVLVAMKSALRDSGEIIITFGPLWYAPYGSHTHMFTKVPWVNLLFPERAVMAVRSNFRQDGATNYFETGMNKMTVTKFENIVSAAGLKYTCKTYVGVKQLNGLTRIPVLRELFTNRINCILSRQ